MGRCGTIIALLAVAPALKGARQHFELLGRVTPPPARAVAILSASTSPFNARTLCGGDGTFKFKRLAPDSYSLRVFAPGVGEVERTIAVGPSFADKKGRVRVEVPFSAPEMSTTLLKSLHSVDVRDLSLPNSAKLDFVEARRLLGRNDTAGAIRRLELAVKAAPHFSAAWNELGVIAFHGRRYEEAEGYFRKALEHDPGAYWPTVNLGGVLLNLGRSDEALKYNSFAVARNPGDPLANSQLGMTYMLLGNDEAAIKYLSEAKRLDPSHFSKPQLYLADIYERQGKLQEALLELQDFLARHPDSPEAAKAKERAERLQGRPSSF